MQNPKNPHSYFKTPTERTANDCGYEVSYTAEHETIFTKRFLQKGILTVVRIIIDKFGNVRTISNTNPPSAIYDRYITYENSMNISTAECETLLKKTDITSQIGYTSTESNTFNSFGTTTFNTDHAYYTEQGSDDRFITLTYVQTILPVVTSLTGFFLLVASAFAFFHKLKSKLPFTDADILFVMGTVNSSKDSNKISIRQNRNVFTIDAILKEGRQGLKGYDRND